MINEKSKFNSLMEQISCLKEKIKSAEMALDYLKTLDYVNTQLGVIGKILEDVDRQLSEIDYINADNPDKNVPNLNDDAPSLDDDDDDDDPRYDEDRYYDYPDLDNNIDDGDCGVYPSGVR